MDFHYRPFGGPEYLRLFGANEIPLYKCRKLQFPGNVAGNFVFQSERECAELRQELKIVFSQSKFPRSGSE